jgi:hypothetical protein
MQQEKPIPLEYHPTPSNGRVKRRWWRSYILGGLLIAYGFEVGDLNGAPPVGGYIGLGLAAIGAAIFLSACVWSFNARWRKPNGAA